MPLLSGLGALGFAETLAFQKYNVSSKVQILQGKIFYG
jgi:hypothetical protein